MGDLWQDLKYGARSLAKQRGFTTIVVLTLAIGIGINTAVFSVVDAVLFRPLPFANPERLVDIYEQESANTFSLGSLQPEQIATWRSQSQVFEAIEAYSIRNFTMTGGPEPEDVTAVPVGPGLFSLLGIAPQMGRAFTEQDATFGNDQVVILSETFWRTRFGGAPDVIGRTVSLSDKPYTVIGVMPAKFKFPYRLSTFWVPLTPTPVAPGKRAERLPVVARLKAGVALEKAQAALDAMRGPLTKDRPDIQWGVKLASVQDHRVNPRPRQALLVLLGAVGFVLLLTCANAANLLLARGAGRQGEIAIRLALGARRGRLIRQLLSESLLLAIMGGLLGTALAWVGVGALAAMVPDELTFLTVAKIDMDPRVLLFTLGITLLTGVLFGLMPALQTSRPNLQSALGGVSGKATADRAHNRLRNALVIVEVALSLVLMIGAGLMVRRFLTLSTESPGFDPSNLVAADIRLPEHRYPTVELQRAFFDRMKTSILEVPGVDSVTVAGGLPPSGGGFQFDLDVEIEGRPPIAKDKNLILPYSTADHEYFTTMRIPILRGRGFLASDADEPESLMIVNQEMAQKFWPNESPVGQRIRFSSTAKWRRVVGVSGNVLMGKPGSGFSQMAVYYPLAQEKNRFGSRTLVARTTMDPRALAAAMKDRIRLVDKDQPVSRIDTADVRLGEALAEPRFYLRLLTCFAFVTLLLVSMGLYGVMSHAVVQRTREIGIRQALGARARGHHEPRAQTRAGSDVGGHCPGCPARPLRGAGHGRVPVRRARHRSADLRAGRLADGGGRRSRLLDPRPASHACRSAGRVTPGLIRRGHRSAAR